MSDAYYNWFRKGIEPSERLSVSEWSDKYRFLSSRASSEPGPWRTDRTPYLKEVMDCLSTENKIEKVIFMKASQIGATECGNNWIGYIIDHCPAPMLSVSPTVELAKRSSKQRIAPLIEECPAIKSKVKSSRERDSGNTVLAKEFPGGILILTGANSAVGLRSLPARYLFLDEVDAYPGDVDGEGDPVALAEARTRTFNRRKIFIVSTPTIEGRSRVAIEFDKTDKRYFHVPCPRCGGFQTLKWTQVKWQKDSPLDAHYECELCEKKFENWEKTQMLEAGYWEPTEKTSNPKNVGFHLNSLYSPVGWSSWGELAEQFEKSEKVPELKRGFVNTVLGETWKEKGDAPEWERIYARRESYKIDSIPQGVLFLTAGVDVQKDRLELEVVGWGRDKQSWSISYRVYYGDTSNLDDDCWRQLDDTVSESWIMENGSEMQIKLMAVDSGFNTQIVYSWCRKYHITKVIAVKGQDSLSTMIGQPKAADVNYRGKKMRGGLKFLIVGTSLIKTETYSLLRVERAIEEKEYPPGYCHFPEYNEDYFRMLTAEEMVKKMVRGYVRYEWNLIRKRNEALDCRVYARAVASVCGLDRFKASHWDRLEQELGVYKYNQSEKKKKPQKKVTIKRRESSFL